MSGSVIEGEDDSEDSSSPYRTMPNQFKSALDEFREKWQQELKTESTEFVDDGNETLSNLNITIDSDESKAEELFMKGVEYEKRGKVYDALNFYRRAVQIVPDIEFRIYESAKAQVLHHSGVKNNNSYQPSLLDNESDRHEEGSDDEDLANVDLFARFQNAILKTERFIQRANMEKGTIVTGFHISDLPMEIILYIFRWVVSSQLDLRSLEQCASVCKGFYICARDEETWRLACLKVWGVNTGLLKNSSFNSWRQMFIERYRIHFNGCYISKTSYMRYGENSFQDQFYRPVQIVEYFRYIRFFPDGMVQMMTSADDPSQSVHKLRISSTRPEILKGHFRLHSNQVIIVLKRNQKVQNFANNKRRVKDEENAGTQTYFIELEIVNTAKKKFSQLVWKRYTFIQTKNKREVSTDFDITPAKYPPFWFSRVKSYHLESDAPLQ